MNASGDQCRQALIYTTLLPNRLQASCSIQRAATTASWTTVSAAAFSNASGSRRISRASDSYEKLTSEGVSFMRQRPLCADRRRAARALTAAMRRTISSLRKKTGLPRVSILVSPEVGGVDERALIATVLDALREHPSAGRGWRMTGAGPDAESDAPGTLRRRQPEDPTPPRRHDRQAGCSGRAPPATHVVAHGRNHLAESERRGAVPGDPAHGSIDVPSVRPRCRASASIQCDARGLAEHGRRCVRADPMFRRILR